MIGQLNGELVKEAATGVILTGCLFAASVFFPVFGFIAALFIPLPTVYYRLKIGRAAAVWIPALTGILVMAVMGKGGASTLFFMELLAMGFLLGEILAAGLAIEWHFVLPGVVLCVTGYGIVMVAARAAGVGVGDWMAAYVEQNLKLTLALYQSIGVSEETIGMITEQMDAIETLLVRILPGLVMVSVLFTLWVNLLAVRRLLSRQNVHLAVLDALNHWRSPEFFVWGVIALGLAALLPMGPVKLLGINGLLILMCVYFFQGMAIIAYFFEKKRLPKGLRTILYTLIALQQVLLLVVIGIGFFDVWINFRKIGGGKTA